MADTDDARPGEKRVSLPDPDDARLRFIGRIKTPWHRREDCPKQGNRDGPVCQVEVDPAWADALQGIEDYATIELLYWLDQSRRDLATQSPKSDGQTTGTFALRSPVRPNPIGTALVELVRRAGNVLEVRGLDCLNGTPLIDIKPYRCGYSPQATPKPADG